MKALLALAASAAVSASAPVIPVPDYASSSYDIAEALESPVTVCREDFFARLNGGQGTLLHFITEAKLDRAQANRLIEVCVVYNIAVGDTVTALEGGQ